MEEDHTLLWNYMDLPSPEDDLGLYLHMEGLDSSFTSSPSSLTLARHPNSSHSNVPSLSVDQIEEFLFTDEHDHDHLRRYSHDPLKIDDFLCDILLDSPLPLADLHYPSSSSTSSHDNNNMDNILSQSQSQSPSPPEIVSPESHHPDFPSPNVSNYSSPPRDCDLQQTLTNPPLSHNSQTQPQLQYNPELQQPSPPSSHSSQPQLEEDRHRDHVNINHHEDAGDDPITKKRKRQLRNRDAAVRSRERRKMYVRDLEIKSRHYESECRRLGMLLQCYLAENHALRLSLHNNSQAFAASTTKQESAVLLLESLLLGSLLWLLGVIGLLILPRQLLSILEAAHMGVGKNLGRLAPKGAGSNVDGTVELHQSYMMSKSCRGSRRKMRCSVVVVAVQNFRDARLLSCKLQE